MCGGGVSGNGQTKMHELPNIYTQPSAHTSQHRENRCRVTCVHEGGGVRTCAAVIQNAAPVIISMSEHLLTARSSHAQTDSTFSKGRNASSLPNVGL